MTMTAPPPPRRPGAALTLLMVGASLVGCGVQGPALSTTRLQDVPPSLEGAWAEEFEGRAGCSDQAYIWTGDQELRVVMADCTDGQPYAIDNVRYGDGVLTFRLYVPATKYELFYLLRMNGPRELEGRTSGDAPAAVRWRKTTASPFVGTSG